MNVTNMKQCLLLCRNAGVTPFQHGHRGMGKSSSVWQLCEDPTLGGKFPIYIGDNEPIQMKWSMRDLRASQLEASDLRGLPDRLNGRTVYYPPEDMPHGEYKCLECETVFGDNGEFRVKLKMPEACPNGHKNAPGKPVIVLHQGILFLDELNRADDDVLQASFQLVYDRKIGRYILPTGWSVMAAGNYAQGYMVNTFNDPAFLDRFCHLQLTPSKEYTEDWCQHMSKFRGSEKVMQFVTFDDSNRLLGKLPGGQIADMGFTVTASPRSWEFVTRVMAEAEQRPYDKVVVREVLSGIIGQALASEFEQFSIEVTPQMILNDGMDSVKEKLKGFNRNKTLGLVWGVASVAKERFKEEEGRKPMVKNCLDFMQHLAKAVDRDLAAMLGKQLVEGETQNMGAAVLSNFNLAKMAIKYKKDKSGASWIAAINEREDLQKLMSAVSFGNV